MPKMVSLRNYRLATLLGDVLLFEAGVPRDVPARCVEAAMAAGCAPVDPNDAPEHDETARAPVEFQGDMRKSTIYLAIQAIVDRNRHEDFAGAVPKHDVITEMLGYTVARDEVGKVFREFTAARAEGREFGLHPQAQNVLKVLEADTKDELKALAVEFGIPEAKVKGESSRNIRRLILTKFNGIPA